MTQESTQGTRSAKFKFTFSASQGTISIHNPGTGPASFCAALSWQNQCLSSLKSSFDFPKPHRRPAASNIPNIHTNPNCLSYDLVGFADACTCVYIYIYIYIYDMICLYIYIYMLYMCVCIITVYIYINCLQYRVYTVITC